MDGNILQAIIVHSQMGPKRFPFFGKWAKNGIHLIASAGSYYYKGSKMFYKLNSTSNMQGAMAKISLILLGVKLYQYSESVLACFKANPVLKKVWTVS